MSSGARPIIILGAARSGTKFLRDTIGCGGGVAVVPYDVNFVWRTGNEAYASDALPAAACSPDIARQIIVGLHRAAGLARSDDRRLVEKTVSNTLRVDFVARVFPAADFVHIVRDGRDVVASSLRQWIAPLDWRYLARKLRAFPLRNYRYALAFASDRMRASGGRGRAVWGVRYEGIEEDLRTRSLAEVCARQWVESVTAVQSAMRRRTDLRVLEIRYEDLVRDRVTLDRALDWLALSDPESVRTCYQRTVARVEGRPWDAELSGEDAEAVLRILAPLQDELGYV